MRKTSAAARLACLAAACVMTPAAWACGPFFPPELLGNRGQTLAELPEGAFAFEASRLVTPAHAYPVVERADWLFREQAVTRASVEKSWFGADAERIEALRKAPSGALAYARSEGLPEEVRLYVAGAASFNNGEDAAARIRFDALIKLPKDQQTHYGVWAAYMLGRLDKDGPAWSAQHAFEDVRARVAAGAADPLGLAATSLGDEARDFLAEGDDATAIALYAEQAALGSEYGRTSLLQVARALVRDDARLTRAIADPLSQRLVVAYLLTRSGETEQSADEGGGYAYDPTTPSPIAMSATKRVLAALEQAGVDHVAGADRVAALAYRNGEPDLAAKFAARDTGSALAAWVRAKLALRAGDVAAAQREYAQAAKAFPPAETWGTADAEAIGGYESITPACRVEGEQGVLALARGDYVQALAFLYGARLYWHDAAYVAERVLSIDELKAYVDQHVPAGAKAAVDAPGLAYQSTPPSLRALLGRRLLRADRFDEALAYFDDAALKAKAQAYVAARRAATQGDEVARAKGWFDAAVLARDSGMELLGYELAPDAAIFDGNFEDDAGDDAPGSASATDPNAAKTAAPALKLALRAPDEATRSAASAARPPKRFHYRYVAAGFAGNAADLLPRRSQAFAATLCSATGYLLFRDPEAARPYYERYLHQGPHLAWASHFGQACPAPDFAAAAKRLEAERRAHYRHLARRALPYAAAAGIGVVALIAWLVVRRRRARKTG